MQIEEDVVEALFAKADVAPPPPRDLLTRVERRGNRLRRRRLLGTTTAAVLAFGIVGVAGVRVLDNPSSSPTTIGIEDTPATGPSSATAGVAPGLTGSTCDDPGSLQPRDYVGFPCVDPGAGVASEVAADVRLEVGSSLTGATAPRVRLLADDTAAGVGGPSAVGGAFELWDAAHLDTPALVVEIENDGDTRAVLAPVDAGGPVFASPLSLWVLTEAPVSAVRFEPSGTVVPAGHGFARIPDAIRSGITSVVGLDASADTRNGWTLPLSTTPSGILTSEAAYTLTCHGQEGIGTCQAGTPPALSPIASVAGDGQILLPSVPGSSAPLPDGHSVPSPTRATVGPAGPATDGAGHP